MSSASILLSLCIPTYNRAEYLKRLLCNVIPQILESKEKVEICISNNGSKDNTREIVNEFNKEYPNLITYSENEDNLGFDKNVLKVVGMANGEYVWTFSDDDLIVENGFRDVINVIKTNRNKAMGGMVVKFSSYSEDRNSGKNIRYQTSVDENKPEIYGGLTCLEMLQDGNAYQGMSELIYNNKLLKEIIRDNKEILLKGIGTHHFHMWLYFIMFLLNREAKFYVLNKNIAISPDTISKSKYMMDDHLELIYRGRIQFYDNLLSIVDKSEKDIVGAIKSKLRRRPVLSIIHVIGLYKAFEVVNYPSCVRSIKLSFKYLPFIKAFFVMMSIVIISIIPSSIVRHLWKYSLKVRSRTKEKAEETWFETCVAFGSWSKGGEDGRSAKGTGMFLNTKPWK